MSEGCRAHYHIYLCFYYSHPLGVFWGCAASATVYCALRAEVAWRRPCCQSAWRVAGRGGAGLMGPRQRDAAVSRGLARQRRYSARRGVGARAWLERVRRHSTRPSASARLRSGPGSAPPPESRSRAGRRERPPPRRATPFHPAAPTANPVRSITQPAYGPPRAGAPACRGGLRPGGGGVWCGGGRGPGTRPRRAPAGQAPKRSKGRRARRLAWTTLSWRTESPSVPEPSDTSIASRPLPVRFQPTPSRDTARPGRS